MNRLAGSTSPYLRQHADNPVDWWPWIPEAFADAKRRNVPVHLSIGYAACHWCHVMARESFSDPTTADAAQPRISSPSRSIARSGRRSTRSTCARCMRSASRAAGRSRCSSRPTPSRSGAAPIFRRSRAGAGRVFARSSARCRPPGPPATRRSRTNAAALREHLNQPVAAADRCARPGASSTRRRRRSSRSGIRERGSFNGAPKFPNPVVLEVLWRAYRRTGDAALSRRGPRHAHLPLPGRHLRPCRRRLRALFGRCRLARPAFREDALRQRPAAFAALVRLSRDRAATVSDANRRDGRLAVREMQLPGGGFASSLDADTEHEEGLTYVWSWSELQEALGSDFDSFAPSTTFRRTATGKAGSS